MIRLLAVAIAVLVLAGCQSAPKPVARESSTPAPASGTPAVNADAPQLIGELTDQTVVWECPNCGMTFDRAGQCSMGDGELVETRVEYICPANGRSIGHAGKCPDCNMNTRVEKTAVAAVVAPEEGGK
jgi:predicted RNA-binding Zn-ribbon protein involved in translation (DUF1610 family)